MKGEGNKERIKFGKLNVDFLVNPDGDLHFFITMAYLVSCATAYTNIDKITEPSKIKLS